MHSEELARSQHLLNRSSAARWALFEEHRRHVTELVLDNLPPDGGTVCILGAGNCNDVDLARLGQGGAIIDLVDVDGAALSRGVSRQNATDLPVRLHGGVDITGIWPRLAELTRPADDAVVEALITSAQESASLPFGPYDVVVSPTVLTQLLNTAADGLGRDHERLHDLTMAMRAGHLRTLSGLIRPGGRALLVTEIISNRELPELDTAEDHELPGLALRAVMLQQLFAATSPAGVVSWLVSNRPHGARLARPGIVGPWRWRLSPVLSYLVIGVIFSRSG